MKYKQNKTLNQKIAKQKYFTLYNTYCMNHYGSCKSWQLDLRRATVGFGFNKEGRQIK